MFVSDITHHELEDRVRRQAVELFEKQGRAFQHTLHSIFTESIHEIDPDQKQGSSSGAGQAASSQGRQTLLPRQGQQQFGFVSPQAFISTLKKLGFKLSSSDVDRLVVRFDVYGQGTLYQYFLSTPYHRFLSTNPVKTACLHFLSTHYQHTLPNTTNTSYQPTTGAALRCFDVYT